MAGKLAELALSLPVLATHDIAPWAKGCLLTQLLLRLAKQLRYRELWHQLLSPAMGLGLAVRPTALPDPELRICGCQPV